MKCSPGFCGKRLACQSWSMQEPNTARHHSLPRPKTTKQNKAYFRLGLVCGSGLVACFGRSRFVVRAFFSLFRATYRFETVRVIRAKLEPNGTNSSKRSLISAVYRVVARGVSTEYSTQSTCKALISLQDRQICLNPLLKCLIRSFRTKEGARRLPCVCCNVAVDVRQWPSCCASVWIPVQA